MCFLESKRWHIMRPPPPRCNPESGAGPQQVLSKHSDRCQLPGWRTRLGRCQRLIQGPPMSCREARPGILGLGWHSPSRASPGPGNFLWVRGRVSGLRVTLPSPSLCRNSHVEQAKPQRGGTSSTKSPLSHDHRQQVSSPPLRLSSQPFPTPAPKGSRFCSSNPEEAQPLSG